jgi:O-Antigen ligase
MMSSLRSDWSGSGAATIGRRFAARPANGQSTLPALVLALVVLTPILGVLIAVAPDLVIAGGLLLLVLGALFASYAFLAPETPWWGRLVFLVVAAQTTLNYGFSGISVGFGSLRLTVCEIVLVIAVCASLRLLWNPKESVSFPLWLWGLLGWLALILTLHLPINLKEAGIEAARDALPTVEVFFIVPGFVITSLAIRQSQTAVRGLWRFLVAIAIFGAMYGVLYSQQDLLQAISPRFVGIQTAGVQILGYFVSWPMMGVMGMYGVLIWRWAVPTRPAWQSWLSFTMILASSAAFVENQSRNGYVAFMACFVVLALIGGQRRNVRFMSLLISAGVATLILIQVSGIQLKGRIGLISLDTVVGHMMTLVDSESADRAFTPAAEGIDQRHHWAQYALSLWGQSPQTMLLGVGYGIPLTDFTVAGAGTNTVTVREPHNSYLSVLTRSGILGFAVMATLHFGLAFTALRLYRAHRGTNRLVAAYMLGVLLYWVCSMVGAVGEPQFENPCLVVPYFFIAGVTFAFARAYPAPRRIPVNDEHLVMSETPALGRPRS